MDWMATMDDKRKDAVGMVAIASGVTVVTGGAVTKGSG